MPQRLGHADLSTLIADSSAVIIGTPQTNLSKLTANGVSIALDYQVRVEYVYKGRLRDKDTVSVMCLVVW